MPAIVPRSFPVIGMKTSAHYIVCLTQLLAFCSLTIQSPLPDITTLPQTTRPPGCFYNNKYYPPGTQIDNGYDPHSNWCYGTHCGMDGQILNWDNFNCVTTPSPTTPTTTPPYPTTPRQDMTTIPQTTRPPGCFYNNKYYPPGTQIENGYDPHSNWCYGTQCDMYGQIQNWDDFNCVTTPPTTVPPTTVPYPTTPRQGCYYNGRLYHIGSKVMTGPCSSVYCDRHSQLIYGDDFNCRSTLPNPHAIG